MMSLYYHDQLITNHPAGHERGVGVVPPVLYVSKNIRRPRTVRASTF